MIPMFHFERKTLWTEGYVPKECQIFVFLRSNFQKNLPTLYIFFSMNVVIYCTTKSLDQF